MDLNGKDPLVEVSSEWLRALPSERRRSSERHRVRRRARKPSNIRSRIRLRVWLACAGALFVMAIGIYFALGHERGGEAGQLLGPSSPAARARRAVG